MRNTEVRKAVQTLVDHNKGMGDRILFLWWGVQDIEIHADGLTDEQLTKLWRKVWNDPEVHRALKHAETIVEDALEASAISLDGS